MRRVLVLVVAACSSPSAHVVQPPARHPPPAPPPGAVTGARIAATPRGALVIDADTGNLIATDDADKVVASLAIGRDAGLFAYDADRQVAFVADRMADRLVVIDTRDSMRELARWPTPEALASASAADVIRAWQGLGYNRRAISLHRAARHIVERGWPDDLTELPGVGEYTAAAVRCFAFGEPVLPLDTNIRRVLDRTGHAFEPAGAQALTQQHGGAERTPRGSPARLAHLALSWRHQRCHGRAHSLPLSLSR